MLVVLLWVVLSVLMHVSLLANETVTYYYAAPTYNSAGSSATFSDPFFSNDPRIKEHIEECRRIQSKSLDDVQSLCQNKTPNQLFNDFSYYANHYYLHLISNQPGFEEFILKLHERITQDHKYRKSLRYKEGFVKKGDFLKLIDRIAKYVKEVCYEREHQFHESQSQLTKNKRLHIPDTASLRGLIETCHQQACDAQASDNNVIAERVRQRAAAAQKTLENQKTTYDYSRSIKTYPTWQDQDAEIFNNCYGTALDQQLHEELCDTRVRMMQLTSTYPSHDYPHVYAPIVYRCTALAKQERDLTVAFGLADFSDAVVRVLTRGMQIVKEVSGGSYIGMKKLANTALDFQHWAEVVTALPHFMIKVLPSLLANSPQLIAHGLAFAANECACQDSLDQAFITGNDALLEQRCEGFAQESRVRLQAFEQRLKEIAAMSWHDLGMHGTYYGGLLVLDVVGLHALNLAATSAGRKLMSELATVLETSVARQKMAEVAGIGKIAAEEGIEAAYKVSEVVKESASIIKQPGKPLVQVVQELQYIEVNRLRSIGNNIWQSPGGLIFESDPKFGNRFYHVLEHLKPNLIKKQHSVFNVPKDKIIALLDEAWKLKPAPLPSDSMVYIVNMNRTIGTQGETGIRIVVKAGTSKIVTAYPVIIKK